MKRNEITMKFMKGKGKRKIRSRPSAVTLDLFCYPVGVGTPNRITDLYIGSI